MGSIKSNKAKEQSHKLSDKDFAYVQLLNEIKTRFVDDMNQRISSVLNSLAKTEMGYDKDGDLQFELDFADESHTLKVTKL